MSVRTRFLSLSNELICKTTTRSMSICTLFSHVLCTYLLWPSLSSYELLGSHEEWCEWDLRDVRLCLADYLADRWHRRLSGPFNEVCSILTRMVSFNSFCKYFSSQSTITLPRWVPFVLQVQVPSWILTAESGAWAVLCGCLIHFPVQASVLSLHSKVQEW